MTEGIFLCVGINAFVLVIPRIYCCQVANKLGKIYLTQYPYYDNVGYSESELHLDSFYSNTLQSFLQNISFVHLS